MSIWHNEKLKREEKTKSLKIWENIGNVLVSQLFNKTYPKSFARLQVEFKLQNLEFYHFLKLKVVIGRRSSQANILDMSLLSKPARW